MFKNLWNKVTGKPTKTSQQMAVAEAIFEFFEPKLGSRGGIAAVTNADEESALNPNARGDGGTSFGLWQMHNDRSSAGKGTVLQQCEGAWEQLQTTHTSAQVAIRSAGTAAQATYAWCKLFEIPADVEKVAANRAAHSALWSSHFNVK